MYLNQVTLYGNLTRDPEMKSLPSGTCVTNFSIATNRVYNDRDGKRQEQTEYHNVVAFAKQAELINQYCRKGSPLYVEGRLQTRSWDKDGQKQYRTEVLVEKMQFGPKSGTAAAPRPHTASSTDAGNELPDYPEEEINPEDIPF